VTLAGGRQQAAADLRAVSLSTPHPWLRTTHIFLPQKFARLMLSGIDCRCLAVVERRFFCKFFYKQSS
jgi:hypothetical protein